MSKQTVSFLSIPMIRTRMAEDLVPDDKHNSWYLPMGMLPGSEEVAAMEKAAGQARRNHMKPLTPTIDLFTGIATDLVKKSILLNTGREVDGDGHIPIGLLSMVNLAVTRAVFAQLLDLGVITISGKITDMVDE